MSERRELSREFILKNPAGEEFITFAARDDAPRLVLTGPGGIAYRNAEGTPEFAVQDEASTLRLKGSWGGDELTIALHDEKGQMCLFLKVDSAFAGVRVWGNPPGECRKTEHPKGMEYYDEAGHLVWRISSGLEPPPWDVQAERT